jgi:antitoxin component YwqK of YwqJK toxin-antitoxin module
MTIVPSRSAEGRMVYCQTRDEKRSQWIELYEKTGGKRQSCGFAQRQPEGSFTAWHTSGKVWVQGQYLAGKKIRLWKQWDEAGALVAEGEYRDGRLIGGAPVGGIAVCETVIK